MPQTERFYATPVFPCLTLDTPLIYANSMFFHKIVTNPIAGHNTFKRKNILPRGYTGIKIKSYFYFFHCVFFPIRPPPGLLPVLGPLERYCDIHVTQSTFFNFFPWIAATLTGMWIAAAAAVGCRTSHKNAANRALLCDPGLSLPNFRYSTYLR